MELEASFSALESAVEHIGWMLRQDPMQRVTLDILPPVEVQAPCAVCDARLMVPLETARRILAGTDWVEHDRKNNRVLSLAPAHQEDKRYPSVHPGSTPRPPLPRPSHPPRPRPPTYSDAPAT